MERVRVILQKLLHPSGWVLMFLPPVSFAALIFIFAAQNTSGAPAYMIYGMSAYSFMLLHSSTLRKKVAPVEPIGK